MNSGSVGVRLCKACDASSRTLLKKSCKTNKKCQIKSHWGIWIALGIDLALYWQEMLNRTSEACVGERLAGKDWPRSTPEGAETIDWQRFVSYLIWNYNNRKIHTWVIGTKQGLFTESCYDFHLYFFTFGRKERKAIFYGLVYIYFSVFQN